MPVLRRPVEPAVKNGRYQLEMRRPLFPRKQTWTGPARAGKLGEFQRFSPGGLFGLSFNFLRMNQAHRSAAIVPQRFDHPHHGLERTHWLMVMGASGQNQISMLAPQKCLL